MTAINIKIVQTTLAKEGFPPGPPDGLNGPKTRSAVVKYLGMYAPYLNWHRWSDARQRVAVMQLHFKSLKIETGITDGYIGPQTLYALEVWRHIELTGKEPEPWRDNIKPPVQKPAKGNWPRQRDLTKYFGPVGKNQTMLNLPFPMLIAWNKKQVIKRFSIHEKCHDSTERVLKRIACHYSPAQIVRHGFNLFGGCLNVRKMRGGSSWSTHSWGIAIDFDPIRNQLRWGKDRAYLDEPECVQFWKFWEEEGWLSLGRAKNFDWMHVQAARL